MDSSGVPCGKAKQSKSLRQPYKCDNVFGGGSNPRIRRRFTFSFAYNNPEKLILYVVVMLTFYKGVSLAESFATA